MRRLLVLAALAAGITPATPAHADPDSADAQFIAVLDKAGITYHSPDQAIAAAKAACSLMSGGQSGADVVKKMIESNPGFAEVSAQRFAAIAASTYCPQLVNGGSR